MCSKVHIDSYALHSKLEKKGLNGKIDTVESFDKNKSYNFLEILERGQISKSNSKLSIVENKNTNFSKKKNLF